MTILLEDFVNACDAVINDDPLVNIINDDEDVALFFEDEKESFLEAMYLSEISKPKSLGSLKYRMQAPDFLNETITEFFNQEILKIHEHEGKSYDWELHGKKISVKSLHAEIFPRSKKRGGKTKGTAIQLKNTKESIVLKDDEFDYLLITVAPKKIAPKKLITDASKKVKTQAKKENYGMYLFSYQKVKELLENSYLYNGNCDKNGYDGKGQIKLYIKDKFDCLAAIEMDTETLEKLKLKYKSNVSDKSRDAKWLRDQSKCVKKQIALSRGKND